MRFRISKGSIVESLVENYFYIALGVYLLTMLLRGFRPGVAISLVLFCILFELFFKMRYVSKLDMLIIIYILYNTISICWMNVEKYTISVYFEEYITSILPILLFWATKIGDKEKILNGLLYSTLICVVLGFALFIIMPEFYREFEYSQGYAVSSRIEHCRQGLASYIGRIPLGTYTVIAAAIALKEYLKKNYSIKYLIYFGILVGGSILTSQRSSWFGSALLCAFLLYSLLTSGKKKVFVQTLVLLFVGIYIAFHFMSSTLVNSTQIVSKSTNILTAVFERNGTWAALLERSNILFGGGLGTGGHRARVITSSSVTDGNYIKIIGEIGVIGLLLFFAIAFIVLFKLWKKKDILSCFSVLLQYIYG